MIIDSLIQMHPTQPQLIQQLQQVADHVNKDNLHRRPTFIQTASDAIYKSLGSSDDKYNSAIELIVTNAATHSDIIFFCKFYSLFKSKHFDKLDETDETDETDESDETDEPDELARLLKMMPEAGALVFLTCDNLYAQYPDDAPTALFKSPNRPVTISHTLQGQTQNPPSILHDAHFRPDTRLFTIGHLVVQSKCGEGWVELIPSNIHDMYPFPPMTRFFVEISCVCTTYMSSSQSLCLSWFGMYKSIHSSV
jgi:hypothetical protein